MSLDEALAWRQVTPMRGSSHLLAAVLLCASGAAVADEQPICPTRPGKSTAPCTVAAGHFQIETGLADWSVQNSGGERDTSFAIGETTFKYGLTDRSDIELDVTPRERSTSRAGGVHHSISGFGDLIASYKQELTSPDAALQVTVLPFVKIPTANHNVGNGKWEGGLLLPILSGIGKSPFSINLTPEFDWAADADGQGHHAAMAQVASLGFQASSKLSLSAEIWGQWDWDPSGTIRQYSADGSVAYLVGKDLQLDAGANFGLNKETPDIELYTGVSVRF
jgi:Putative MetA-pathway of phenol degradation